MTNIINKVRTIAMNVAVTVMALAIALDLLYSKAYGGIKIIDLLYDTINSIVGLYACAASISIAIVALIIKGVMAIIKKTNDSKVKA